MRKRACNAYPHTWSWRVVRCLSAMSALWLVGISLSACSSPAPRSISAPPGVASVPEGGQTRRTEAGILLTTTSSTYYCVVQVILRVKQPHSSGTQTLGGEFVTSPPGPALRVIAIGIDGALIVYSSIARGARITWWLGRHVLDSVPVAHHFGTLAALSSALPFGWTSRKSVSIGVLRLTTRSRTVATLSLTSTEGVGAHGNTGLSCPPRHS